MSNSVNWDLIPEDVEAIVTYDNDVPSHYKMIGGILHVQRYKDGNYHESCSESYDGLEHCYGDRLHLRPSGPFSPSEIKFLHETTDVLHEMINTVDPKSPSISDILQEAQQAILQHHNINGKVTFTVTTE